MFQDCTRITDHYHLVLRDYEKLTESHLTGCIKHLSKVFTRLLPHNESISSVQVDLNQLFKNDELRPEVTQYMYIWGTRVSICFCPRG